MNLSDLLSMNQTDLNKLNKAQIIECITKQGHMHKHYMNRSRDLEKVLDDNSTKERVACITLASMVGVEIPKDEFSRRTDYSSLDISEIVGLVGKRLSEIGR